MKADNEKPKVVLASGAFDLVHYGHVRYLEEAKKAGGGNARLIVVVARDKTIERLKKRRPVIPEDQRRAVIETLKPVDEAVLGNIDFSLEATINKLRPDIIALGYDQKEMEKAVKKFIFEKGLNIRILRIKQFGISELNSSSKIKRKILKNFT